MKGMSLLESMIYLNQNRRNLFFITSRHASEDNKIDRIDAAQEKIFADRKTSLEFKARHRTLG